MNAISTSVLFSSNATSACWKFIGASETTLWDSTFELDLIELFSSAFNVGDSGRTGIWIEKSISKANYQEIRRSKIPANGSWARVGYDTRLTNCNKCLKLFISCHGLHWSARTSSTKLFCQHGFCFHIIFISVMYKWASPDAATFRSLCILTRSCFHSIPSLAFHTALH